MTKEEFDLIEGMITVMVEKLEQFHDRLSRLELKLMLLEKHPPESFRDKSNGE